MKDVVFPFRLIWTVQEKVVGVGKGEVWDLRERRPEDHRQGEDGGGEEKGVSPSVGIIEEALSRRMGVALTYSEDRITAPD